MNMKLLFHSTVCRFTLGIGVALSVAGCTAPNGPSDKQQAILKADAIYKAIEAKDFKKAASLYSPQFYKTTTPEKWIAHLEDLHKQFGDLKRYDLKKVITNSNYNGVDLTLKYKTHYTKHDAFEEMTFATQPGGGQLAILGYKVEMDRFTDQNSLLTRGFNPLS